jgi:hypothetical protein
VRAWGLRWCGGGAEEGWLWPASLVGRQACVENAERLVATWRGFFGELFVRFMDGNVKTASTDPNRPMPKVRRLLLDGLVHGLRSQTGCSSWVLICVRQVQQPGYPQPWLDVVASQTGDRFLVPEVLGVAAGGQDGSPRMKGI